MFLRTDLTYNDNGDISFWEQNGTYRHSYSKYSKTRLTPKEKYVQLYRAQLKLNREPTSEYAGWTHTRRLINRAFKLLLKYYRRKDANQPLHPYQERIEALLSSEEELRELSSLEVSLMADLQFVNAPIFEEYPGMLEGVKRLYLQYKLTPSTDWNEQVEPLPSVEQRRREKEAEEWQRRWGNVRLTLPEADYDHTAMEWRENLQTREQRRRDEVRRQAEIEMDVAGDAELAQELQEQWQEDDDE